MAIDLENGYAELEQHIGHEIVCVGYGLGGNPELRENVAIECETCGMVLLDFDHPNKGGSA